ncbi:MAG: glycosyltransferase [Thermofilum sp.]|jgi:glycosyltransferase involved in cell wall biosynthesis|nr:glycosyltransferase [Thermofilum sp.]
MKILIVVENFDPSRGYLEYYLFKELIKLKIKTIIITFGHYKRFLRINKKDYKIVYLPSLLSFNSYHFPNLIALIHLLKIIKEESPQIIHCQPLFSPTCVYLLAMKKVFKYKCVGSLITGEFHLKSITTLIFFKLVIWVISLVKSNIDHFFAINSYVKNYISQTFGISSNKITIIPLGVDTELFRFDECKRIQIRQRLGIQLDDKIVCYSGRILPEKKLESLIMAIAPIVKNDPKVKLLVIGDDNPKYLKFLKQLIIENQLESNVIFHPTVHRTQLPSFYSACDIAVWPAAPTISILEAASMGIPVISGSGFFYKHLAEMGAIYLIKRGDWLTLSLLIYNLLKNDDLRKRMRVILRNLMIENFDWRNIAKEYFKIYWDILK